MINLKYKVNRIKIGSTIGVISPSWSGPNVFPVVFNKGLENLKTNFGFKIKEFENTRAAYDNSTDYINKRVADIHAAFLDMETEAIFLSIGGDDSVRILPFLNPEILTINPKIVMGFSDSTTFLIYLAKLGIPTFHGPSIMAGFAEPEGLNEEFINHFKTFFFDEWDTYTYPKYTKWTEDYISWTDENYLNKKREYKENNNYSLINDGIKKTGTLLGGCIEITEMMKGTEFGISTEDWSNVTFFFETSEEKPSPSYIKYALRSYGVAGAWNGVNCVIIGKPKGYSDEDKLKLEQVVKEVIVEEFGRKDITIIGNCDIGHTQPMLILPLGCKIEINTEKSELKLLESPFK